MSPSVSAAPSASPSFAPSASPTACTHRVEFESHVRYEYAANAKFRETTKALQCMANNDMNGKNLELMFSAVEKNGGCPEQIEGGQCTQVSKEIKDGGFLLVIKGNFYENLQHVIEDGNGNYEFLMSFFEDEDAIVSGKGSYPKLLHVGDKFSMPYVTEAVTYMVFGQVQKKDENKNKYLAPGDVALFATFDPGCYIEGRYGIGEFFGNSPLVSFGSALYGTVASQVYLQFQYKVVNMCDQSGNVYHLQRNYGISSCEETGTDDSDFDFTISKGWNPLECVAEGSTDVACPSDKDGVALAARPGTNTFTDQLDGLQPIDLLTQRAKINTDTTVKYDDWSMTTETASAIVDGCPGQQEQPVIDLTCTDLLDETLTEGSVWMTVKNPADDVYFDAEISRARLNCIFWCFFYPLPPVYTLGYCKGYFPDFVDEISPCSGQSSGPSIFSFYSDSSKNNLLHGCYQKPRSVELLTLEKESVQKESGLLTVLSFLDKYKLGYLLTLG